MILLQLQLSKSSPLVDTNNMRRHMPQNNINIHQKTSELSQTRSFILSWNFYILILSGSNIIIITIINGCNTLCLSQITGKSTHEETTKYTTTYDLVAAIRRRRHQWLDHILRLKGHHYIKEIVKTQVELNLPGNITMNTPERWRTYKELEQLAANRDTWRQSFDNPVPTTTLESLTDTHTQPSSTTAEEWHNNLGCYIADTWYQIKTIHCQ